MQSFVKFLMKVYDDRDGDISVDAFMANEFDQPIVDGELLYFTFSFLFTLGFLISPHIKQAQHTTYHFFMI